MEFFKKRSTAWRIFAITVVFAVFTGQMRKPVSQVEILPPGEYIQDNRDLLSDSTEEYITLMNNGLASRLGAEIQVAVLETTDGKDPFDVALDIAYDTNLSARCCVFLVVTQDAQAVIIQGEELVGYFTDKELSDILNTNFTEDMLLSGDVDFPVRASFDRLIDMYEDYYDVSIIGSEYIEKTYEEDDTATTIMVMILAIIVLILVVWLITRPGRRRTVFVPTGGSRPTRGYYPPRGSYRTPPPYSGGSSSTRSSSRSGGFGSSSKGGSFSSSSSRSSSRTSSRSGGFGSSSRGGSFSSSSRSSRSGGFSSGGSRGGSFGGGSRGGSFRK